MKKSKICFIIPSYQSKTATHYNHIYAFLEELAKETDVFLFAESGTSKVRIRNLSGYYVSKHKSFLFKVLERVFIFATLRSKGYRMYYCHYSELSTILSSIITRVSGGKTYKWHCVQEHYYAKPFEVRFFKEKLTRELPLKLSFSLTNFIVTGSPQLRTYYKKYFGINEEKIIVIPNVVDIKRFKKKSINKSDLRRKLNLPDKTILLFVHRLSERKGADRLIDMAVNIKENGFNLFILAIGEGPLKSILIKNINGKGLTKQIKLIGSVSNNTLPDYYLACDIFIMPSRVEEFGRVQIEAMAAGLPIIATKTIGTDYVLKGKQRNWILDQKDFRKIPLFAQKLLESNKNHRDLVETGIERSKIFSPQRIVELFQEKIIRKN